MNINANLFNGNIIEAIHPCWHGSVFWCANLRHNVLLGFPVALVLSWAYEVTPQGIRKDSAGDIESITEVEDYLDGAPSIAVLPFDDMSEKGNHAYFCEGMA